MRRSILSRLFLFAGVPMFHLTLPLPERMGMIGFNVTGMDHPKEMQV